MGILKSMMILVSFVFALSAIAMVPKIKQVPVSDVFAPAGFDSSENVEIVVAGYLT